MSLSPIGITYMYVTMNLLITGPSLILRLPHYGMRPGSRVKSNWAYTNSLKLTRFASSKKRYFSTNFRHILVLEIQSSELR